MNARALGRLGKNGAVVPAGWAAYNGVWVVILAAFGASALPLWLYGGAVALTEAAAAGVLLAHWRVLERHGRYVLDAGSPAPVIAAIGLALLALGPSLGPWLYPPGGVTVTWAALLVVRDARWRRRAIP